MAKLLTLCHPGVQRRVVQKNLLALLVGHVPTHRLVHNHGLLEVESKADLHVGALLGAGESLHEPVQDVQLVLVADVANGVGKAVANHGHGGLGFHHLDRDVVRLGAIRHEHETVVPLEVDLGGNRH